MTIISLFAALVLAVLGPRFRSRPSGSMSLSARISSSASAATKRGSRRRWRRARLCSRDNPRHAEALVWHGAGCSSGPDRLPGRRHGQRGSNCSRAASREMTDAVSLEPDNVAVLIPRGAVLLQATRTMAPPWPGRCSSRRSADYEKVLRDSGERTSTRSATIRRASCSSASPKGAPGSAQAGRTRAYFERLIKDAPTSGPGRTRQRDGCRPARCRKRRHRLHRLPQVS